MTKTITSAMRAHLDEDVTRLATIWRITRADGRQLFFTDHDRDIVFAGDVYRAPIGFDRTAITTSVSFSVDNLDVVGFFEDGGIEETEARAGLFDGASIEIALVSFDDPDGRGEIALKRGTIGEVRTTPQGFFLAELRGLAQPLQQNTLSLFSPHCRADLGDERCRFPIKPPEIARETAYGLGAFVRVATTTGMGFRVFEERIYECTGAGTTASSQPAYDTTIGASTTDGTAAFTARESFMRVATVEGVEDQRELVASSELAGYADDWFNEGVLTFETGNNAGMSCEIKRWVSTTLTLELWESVQLEVQVGDQFRLYPGCRKRIVDDCRDRFRIPGSLRFANGNALNFRGEPYVPGGGLSGMTPNAG